MITVLEKQPGTFEPIGGNPTLDSIDGEQRAPLQTILHESWTAAQRAKFRVFKVTPATVPQGHRIVSRSYTRSGNTVTENLVTEAIPPAQPEAFNQVRPRELLEALLLSLTEEIPTFTKAQAQRVGVATLERLKR